MVKKDELLEELLEWKQEQEKQEAVRKATAGMIMLRCSTVVIAIWTTITMLGAWVVDNYNGLEAGIRAFLEAKARP